MHNLRPFLIGLMTLIGMVTMFVLLYVITGFLVGIFSYGSLSNLLADAIIRINESRNTWWLSVSLGWFLAGWAFLAIIFLRSEVPILIREDEHGVLEVSPSALAGLAKAEIVSLGLKNPRRVVYRKIFGQPSLHIWCDLNSGDSDEGPLSMGKKIRDSIRYRIKRELLLEGVTIRVIHNPA